MDLIERVLNRSMAADLAIEECTPERRKPLPAQHWARGVMMERVAYMKEMARYSQGCCEQTLREFPGHAAGLQHRGRTGPAELDARCARLLVVLAGAATLVTGGTLLNPQQRSEGLVQGASIDSGVAQKLGPGDIVHIPAGVAHQLQLGGEQSISCFTLRMEEPKTEPA